MTNVILQNHLSLLEYLSLLSMDTRTAGTSPYDSPKTDKEKET